MVTSAVKGNALLIRTQDLMQQNIPMDLGTMVNACIVVCDSRVKHSIAIGEYRQRRTELESGQEVLMQLYPQSRDLGMLNLEQLEHARHFLDPIVYKRVRHVISENSRVLSGAEALRRGDAMSLGRFMLASHASQRDDFACSCAEVDFLVDTASMLSGCLGSRLTGGGFGGCTISLVLKNEVETFREALCDTYRRRFDIDLPAWICDASDGAAALKMSTIGEDAAS